MEHNKLLSKLNSIKTIETKKINQLQINTEYQIAEADKSKYSALLKLYDSENDLCFRVYLPSRYSCLTEEEIKGLVGLKLKYYGESTLLGKANLEFL